MIHLYLPPCAGLYSYWFGVTAAMEELVPKSDLANVHFHTISGSGFPTVSVRSTAGVRAIYDIWFRRLYFIISNWNRWLFYPLVVRHCTRIIESSGTNVAAANHTIYATKLCTMETIPWTGSGNYDTPTDYAEALTASSFIPGISFQFLYRSARHGYVMDGGVGILWNKIKRFFGLRHGIDSFYRLIEDNIATYHATDATDATDAINLINCDRLLGYASLDPNTLLWRRIFGLYSKDNDAYLAGYADSKRLLVPRLTRDIQLVRPIPTEMDETIDLMNLSPA
jgi:hypothetical protein